VTPEKMLLNHYSANHLAEMCTLMSAF